MQALLSRTAGVLLSARTDSDLPIVRHLASVESWEDVELTHLLSTISDWEEVEAADSQSLVQQATTFYWLDRATSMIRCALAGVSRDLELEVLEYVEELLQTSASPTDVRSVLLVAPLKAPAAAQRLTQRALGANLSAVATLLDSLRDLQPLLSRLVEYWLSLPESMFGDLGRSRQDVWCGLAEEGALVRVIEAASRKAFSAEWNKQAFKEILPASRTAIARIGIELAEKLFPSAPPVKYDELAAYEADFLEDEKPSAVHDFRLAGREALESVIKQVNAIADAVSDGKDHQAQKFLRQLVDAQEGRGDREYAVKTLCNIAQRCAVMFRADFERLCLEKARSLAPADPWTLLQWGNHLKRVGAFDDALRVLKKAAVGDHQRIALSSMAAVWAERGDYERAVSVYKSYPMWESTFEICTGICDVRRYQGQFDEALQGYEEILRRWPGTDRAVAGKAEIAKRKGELGEALSLYDSLVERTDIDDRTRVIYYSAKCNILKQANRLHEALSLADEIVQKAPFLMSARANRGAILGLLGREAEGLKDVNVREAPSAFREWFQHYVRGLLLLKLERHSEARKQLVDNMANALLTGDESTVTRLGAAYSFVSEGLYDDAEESLGNINIAEIHDSHTQYVFLVLKLHVAVAKSQKERIDAVSRQLQEACQSDEGLASVVDALRRGDFRTAKTHELELLLRIAA